VRGKVFLYYGANAWRVQKGKELNDVLTLGCREVGFIEKHGQNSKLV
jgi:hypothetical protein